MSGPLVKGVWDGCLTVFGPMKGFRAWVCISIVGHG